MVYTDTDSIKTNENTFNEEEFRKEFDDYVKQNDPDLYNWMKGKEYLNSARVKRILNARYGKENANV